MLLFLELRKTKSTNAGSTPMVLLHSKAHTDAICVQKSKCCKKKHNYNSNSNGCYSSSNAKVPMEPETSLLLRKQGKERGGRTKEKERARDAEKG